MTSNGSASKTKGSESSPQPSKTKQPKLEQTLGVESSDDKQDSKKDEGEADVSAGEKRDRDESSQSSANKAPKTEDNDGAKKAASSDDKILPGTEKPPPELKPGHEEDAKQGDGAFEALEEGNIYFFYRPKVQGVDDYDKQEKAVSSIDDVQNTHMLLVPQASKSETAPASPGTAEKIAKEKEQNGGQQQPPAGTTGEKAKKHGIGFRLVRLGKKRLPAPEEAIARGLQPGGIGGDSSEACVRIHVRC